MKKIYNNLQDIQNSYYRSVERDESGEFHALKIGLITTHNCTLRCKLCSERTSEYNNRYMPTLEYLKKELDEVFKIFDYIMKFEVTGGEALTRKDLDELLKYLYNFKTQFGRVRLLTNGTIVPPDSVVEALKLFGEQADVLVDDYGEGISINAVKAVDKLKENNISCIHRKQDAGNMHCGGWVDFGDLTKKHSEEEAKQLYKKCIIPNKIGGGVCVGRDGYMSACRVVEQCRFFGITNNSSEYLNVFDDTSIEEKREKLLNIFNHEMFSACQFCNGMYEGSERFVPAEQYTVEEAKKVKRNI